VYQAIRNPRSHGKVEDSEDDAQAMILLVNYLAKIIGESRAPFSRPTFLARVFDPDFVPTKRYGELLVNEIPVKQRIDVFFDVYRDKGRGDGGKLEFFVKALIGVLSEEEKHQVTEAVSEELKHTSDEAVIRTILRILPPQLWQSCEEAARLRIEHRLIGSISEGRYSTHAQRCISGALGTWANSYLSEFSLKKEAYSAIVTKLRSEDSFEHEYVFRFLLTHLDDLVDKPSRDLELILVKRLKEGNARFHDALNRSYLWPNELWSDSVKQAIKDFKAAESAFDAEDDGLPF
jgi:hypothetical protein